MQTLVKIFLAFLLLAASKNAFAVTVNKKDICSNATVPAGWVIANKVWSRSTCGDPTTSQANVLLIEEYDNLPVGTPLTICAYSSPVPSGWVPTTFQWNPSLCGAQFGNVSGPYNTVTIRNALCTNEATNLCVPSLPQFAVISALPTTVAVPYGQAAGSTELAWFASTKHACVWVATEGQPTQLWACDGDENYGVQNWPYVYVGVSQTFIVSPSETSPAPALATVVVNGVEGGRPKISASPGTVTVPTGQTDGSTSISYNLIGANYSSMCIWASNNGGPAELWACGSGLTFSQVWPYVPKGGTSLLWLNPSRTSSTQVLNSVLVTGK